MKLILTLAVAAVAPTATTLTADLLDNNYQEVYNIFDGNLEEMSNAYNEEYNVDWNPSKITHITDVYNDDNEEMGYLVLFDEGYLSYTNEFSVLDVCHYGTPSYYSANSRSQEKLVYKCGAFNGIDPNANKMTTMDYTADNIYYSLKNYYLADGFKINSSMVQIPFFKDAYDSSGWGNYQGITFSYAAPNSGAILSAMSLMYTLKVNGGADLTPYQTSYYTFMKNLEFYTDFNYTSNNTSFMDWTVLFSGINQYLTDNFGTRYQMCETGVTNTTPATTLYYNANSTKTAEYCMRIGQAQQPSWWIFTDYFDIVMADENNFFLDEYDQPLFWIENSLSPYYIVNQNYRDYMFQYYENGVLLT